MAMARAEGRASPELSRPPDGQNTQLRGHWAYIARDGDADGTRAAERLRTRAEAAGILEVRDLYPMNGDFNDDLRRLGAAWLARHVAVQLDPADVRWLRADASGETARAA